MGCLGIESRKFRSLLNDLCEFSLIFYRLWYSRASTCATCATFTTSSFLRGFDKIVLILSHDSSNFCLQFRITNILDVCQCCTEPVTDHCNNLPTLCRVRINPENSSN